MPLLDCFHDYPFLEYNGTGSFCTDGFIGRIASYFALGRQRVKAGNLAAG